MRISSVNLGRVRTLVAGGTTITTGIFKEPIVEPVWAGHLSLVGDEQADLTVHGGPDKAVYAYPEVHYPFWCEFLKVESLGPGSLGENLTVTGPYEDDVGIGERLRIGSAVFVVTQPRMPCRKLALRFGRPDLLKAFLHSARTGYYLRVLEPGRIARGDAVVRLDEADPERLTVAAVVRLYLAAAPDTRLLERALRNAALPQSWRDHFATTLGKMQGDVR